MSDVDRSLHRGTARLSPARPGPLARIGSGLCVVLLAVVVGVLLALAIGGVLAALGVVVRTALDG